MIKRLQIESEKQNHMLEEKNQELINELHHLKECISMKMMIKER